ncbi:PREDICTED: uncharacterized protein LOC109347770 isoform X1 [Lupinus angustifolius]|uniref:uncharacterized protein LOC109347770 isoform X1 n=1 Tax=Lupinus angustifolius TaxID=3871 RepID=UPI00092F985A|nr:PREDICTED: uncharacterized protein LOC109347770 isoform X1 [Lupinus angustifolius]
MSAAVCGSKRVFFEELPPSPPLSKRLRFSSSTSPIPLPHHSLIDQLRNLFPHMDHLLYERAVQESGNDLEAAIKRLNELCLETDDGNTGTAAKVEGDGNASASEVQPAMNNLPVNGAEWVEFFVTEMSVATNVDDARGRAARILELLEKSISARASADAADALKEMSPFQENLMLKQQMEVLLKEKNSFKNAFRIQHERVSDYEDKNQELQRLKQSVSEYQEHIRSLEMKNYTLRLHLERAYQRNNPFPGRFPPDFF